MQTYAPQPFCAPSIRFERPTENVDDWPTVPRGHRLAVTSSPPHVLRAKAPALIAPIVRNRSASALTHAMMEHHLSEAQQADIILRVSRHAAQAPVHERIQTYLQTAMAHTFSDENHAKLYAALLPVEPRPAAAAERTAGQIELTRGAVCAVVQAAEAVRPPSAPVEISRTATARRRRIELPEPRSAAFPFSTRAFPSSPALPSTAQETQRTPISTTAKVFEQLYARLKASPPQRAAQHVITMTAIPSAPPLPQSRPDMLTQNPLFAHDMNVRKIASAVPITSHRLPATPKIVKHTQADFTRAALVKYVRRTDLEATPHPAHIRFERALELFQSPAMADREYGVRLLQNVPTAQAKVRLGNIYSGIYAPHDIGIARDYDAAEALYIATHASFHLISLARTYLGGHIPGKGLFQARQLLRCALSQPGLKSGDYARARELYARLSEPTNHT